MTAVDQKPPASDVSQIADLKRKNLILMGVAVGLAIGLVATGWWAFTSSDSTGSLQEQIEMTEAIADGLGAATEAADARGLGEFFAESALYEDPAAGMAVTGRSAIEAMYMAFLSAEAPIENTGIFVGPGFTVTEFVWTQPCTFAACSPEMFREPVEVRGIVLHLVEDGEVVRETDYIAYPRNVVLP